MLHELQELMGEDQVALVQPVVTRWASEPRAIQAILRTYDPLVASLQHIHIDSGDLSSEAGGLLLVLQEKKNIYLFHALHHILQPLCILSKQLQSAKLTLTELPILLDTCISSLNDVKMNSSTYGRETESFLQNCSFTPIGTCDSSELHQKVIVPFVDVLLKQFSLRFPKNSLLLCASAAAIFQTETEVTSEEVVLQQLAAGHGMLKDKFPEMKCEYRCFRNYLQSLRQQTVETNTATPSSTEIIARLSRRDSVLRESFPALSLAATMVLLCPITTASVERSFSTTNRVATRLRNRITPCNLSHLIRISVEGPEMLAADDVKEIVRLWHASSPNRRIQLP